MLAAPAAAATRGILSAAACLRFFLVRAAAALGQRVGRERHPPHHCGIAASRYAGDLVREV